MLDTSTHRVRRVPARGRAALPILAALAAGCGGADLTPPAQPDAWQTIEAGRFRELRVPPAPGPGFTPIPPEWSGVAFRNALEDESVLESQMRTNGSGVAAGDIDGDGRADLVFAGLDRPNAVYRNLGGLAFEDVTEGSGLARPGVYSTGVALADVDGDRDLDAVLTAIGGGVSVFLNDGTGAFGETRGEGLAGDTGAMGVAIADLDADGDLDLYVTNYKAASVLDLFPPQERTFARTVRRTAAGWELIPPFDLHYELVTRGGEVERRERAEPDAVFLGDGRGGFRPVPFDSVFRSTAGDPLPETLAEWGLAARFGDLDGDGDPDLYVANDLHSPDRLWWNVGGGEFRAAAPEALRSTAASTMAVAFADIDRDGDTDIFTPDMLSRSSRLRKTQDPVARIERPMPGEVRGTQQVPHNALLANRGDGTFAEIARFAGVEASDWSWSSLFVDADLDGYEDLLIANGHIRDLMDADTQIRLRSTTLADWRQGFLVYAPLPRPNVAFRNLGDGRFEEVGEAWGFARGDDIAHGGALADLDGDGDLDVVLNRLDDPALILRNDAAAPRVAVRLVGAPPNTGAVGARIRVRAEGLPDQTAELAIGGDYLSSSEALSTFAMGDAGRATIEVVWPGGGRTVVEAEGANRLYEIEETAGGVAEAATGGTASPGASEGAAAGTPAWFELDPGFAPIHDEPVVDEAVRQPLLPFRLAQLGPQLAFHDLDGDGDPDLSMAQGAGAPPALFRNDAGTLVRLSVAGPRVLVDQTGLLPLPRGDGSGRLIVGLSSYEAPPAETAQVPGAIALAWDAGAFGGRSARVAVGPAVGGGTSASGPLAAADVDGDGRLDLFIGGRVVPGRYPEAADSRLLRGGPDGSLRPDAEADRLLADIGLVSGAVFSDLDRDGDPDLVLALEWGPIRVLDNEGGRFTDVTERLGLDRWTGRWNAVATGDFDEDGRPDLIATSWGENTGDRPSEARPLEVWYGDVDRNGTFDVFVAETDSRPGSPAPRVSLGELSRAVPSVLDRVSTNAEYAEASLERLLGGLPDGRLRATTLSHAVFLARDDGFERRRLPAEAQWAPSLGVAVADADGDGHEDVFLTQNFFATMGTAPRLDAGRGLWLAGDGRGGFRAVPAAESGVAVYGDGRGVAVGDVDGDGRVDLAVGLNGSEARLYRNRLARPGLRVRLVGPPGNPYAVGASLRIRYPDRLGPAREIRAGGGAGSHDDPVQVLGLAEGAAALHISWPDGTAQEVPIGPDVRTLTVRRDETASPPSDTTAGDAGGRDQMSGN